MQTALINKLLPVFLVLLTHLFSKKVKQPHEVTKLDSTVLVVLYDAQLI